MRLHLLVDPGFKLFPVHRRQLGQIGPQLHRVADVDVLNLRLRPVRVPVHQDSNAPGPLPGAAEVISGLWFDPSGTLYAGATNGSLYTVNTVTGDKTLLFSTGITQMSGMTGREIIAEPTSALLFVVVGVVAAWSRRWRRSYH